MADTVAPSSPSNLVAGAQPTPTTVPLSWNLSTDNQDVVAYDVYDGTNLLGTVAKVAPAFTGRNIPAISAYASVFANGRFTTFSYNTNTGYYTTDGITWNTFTLPSSGTWWDAAYGNGTYVVIAQASTGTYAYSTDGVTWTVRTLPAPNATFNWQNLAFGNGVFVATTTGTNTTYFTSVDGITWTQRTLPNSYVWQRMQFVNGQFWIMSNTNPAYYLTSTDGLTWALGSFANPSLYAWQGLTYGNGTYLMSSSTLSIIATSPDGSTWTIRNSGSGTGSRTPLFVNGQFFLMPTSGNLVRTSTDGITWSTAVTLTSASYDYRSSVAGNGMILVLNSSAYTGGGTIQVQPLTTYTATVAAGNTYNFNITARDTAGNTSTPSNTVQLNTSAPYSAGAPSVVTNSPTSVSLTWAPSTSDAGVAAYDVYNGASLVASVTAVPALKDMAWDTTHVLPATASWSNVAYGNGIYVAVNTTVNYVTSVDGVNWTARTLPTGPGVGGVLVFGNGMFIFFVSGSGTGTFYTSPDGVTWAVHSGTGLASMCWSTAAYGNGTFVLIPSSTAANAATNLVYSSTDGVTWTSHTLGATTFWASVTYVNNRFIAVSGADAFNNINNVSSTTISTSTDGVTWTVGSGLPVSAGWNRIAYGNGLYVLIPYINSSSGTPTVYLTSPDLGTWTQRNLPLTGITYDTIVYAYGYFVLHSTAGFVFMSTDGLTWTMKSVSFTAWGRAAVVSRGSFIIMSTNKALMLNMTNPNPSYTATVTQGTNYNFSVQARDAAGNLSTMSPALAYNTAPTVPGDLGVAPTNDRQFELNWGPSTDDIAPVYYDIYNGTTLVGSLTPQPTSMANYSVTYSQYYRTAVVGNGSAVITAGVGGTTATYFLYTTDGSSWSAGTYPVVGSYEAVAFGNNMFIMAAYNTSTVYLYPLISSPPYTATLPVSSTWSCAAYGNGMFVILSGQSAPSTISVTSSDGITWTQHVIPSSTWASVTYGNGMFVAVSASNAVMTSPDGINWTLRSSVLTSAVLNTVTYGNGMFVVTAASTNNLMTSPDGITWTQRTMPSTNALYSVTYGGGVWMAAGATTAMYMSYDAITWTPVYIPVSYTWQATGYIKGSFFALSYNSNIFVYFSMSPAPTVYTVDSAMNTNYSFTVKARDYQGNRSLASPTATFNTFDVTLPAAPGKPTLTNLQTTSVDLSWAASTDDRAVVAYDVYDGTNLLASTIQDIQSTIRPSALSATWTTLMYGNGLFVALNNTAATNFQTSPDGVTWTSQAYFSAGAYPFGAFGHGKFIAMTSGSATAYSSTVGIGWTAFTLPSAFTTIGGLFFAGGRFIALPASTVAPVLISQDGTNWFYGSTLLPSAPWTGLAYGNGLYVITSSTGLVYTSPDAMVWTARTATALTYRSVAFGNGIFVAVASATSSYATSPDGITWTTRALPGTAGTALWQVLFQGNIFVALSNAAGLYMFSTDGLTWTVRGTGNATTGVTAYVWQTLAYGNGMFASLAYSAAYALGIVPATATAVTVPITEGNNYSFNVKARDVAGNTSIAGPSTPYTTLPTVPGQPIVSNPTGTTVDLSWTAATDDMPMAYYDLYTGTTLISAINPTMQLSNRLLPTTGIWGNVTSANNILVAAGVQASGSSPGLAVSTDGGLSWSGRSMPSNVTWVATAYGNGTWVAIALDVGPGYVATSADNGTTWVGRNTLPSGYAWQNVIFANGVFVATATNNVTVYATSVDGYTWTSRTLPVGGYWYALAYGNGLFVTTSRDSNTNFYTSPDGVTWTSRTNPTTGIMSIAYGNGKFVAPAFGSRSVATSTNGTTWSVTSNALPSSMAGAYSVAYGDGVFFATGAGGQMAFSTDGTTWTSVTTGAPYTGVILRGAAYGGGNFVAVPATSSNLGVAATFAAPTTYTAAVTQGQTYNFNVRARDAAGNTSAVTQSTAFSTVPSIPGAITATAMTSTSVTLTWNPSTDDQAVGITYDVYNGTTLLANVATTSYTATIASGTVYNFNVKARDGLNNVSAASETYVVDPALPTAPGRPVATALTGTSLSLTWPTATDDIGISAYEVYNGSTLLSTITGGTGWLNRTLGTGFWNNVAFGNNTFVAISSAPALSSTSTDGINWTLHQLPIGNITWNTIAFGNGVFVVAGPNSSRVLFSTDNGATWGAATLPLNAAPSIIYGNLTYGNGKFVLVTNTGRAVYYSTDGINWLASTYPAISGNPSMYQVTYGNGMFVATSASSLSYITSPDGITWTLRTLPANPDGLTAGPYTMTYGRGRFVGLVNTSKSVYYSADGINWSTSTILTTTYAWKNIRYGNGMFYANVGSSTVAASSPDGITWTQRATNAAQNWQGMTYGNGMFVSTFQANTPVAGVLNTLPVNTYSATIARGQTYSFNVRARDYNNVTSAYSPSLAYDNTAPVAPGQPRVTGSTSTLLSLTWTPSASDSGITYYDVYNGNNLVATTSAVAPTWKTNTIPGYSWRNMAYGNGTFVAVATGNTNFGYSLDGGVTWRTVVANAGSSYWQALTFGAGKFVALGGYATTSSTIGTYSTDGIAWSPITGLPNQYWQAIAYGNGRFVAVSGGMSGLSTVGAYSTDGITWTPNVMPSTYWGSIAYGNGTFVAVPSNTSTASGFFATSPDGVTWTPRTAPLVTTWQYVTFANGVFVAVGYNGYLYYSTDGIAWTAATLSGVNSFSQYRTVVYGNGRFVLVHSNTGVPFTLTSTDGITWTSTSFFTNSWTTGAYGAKSFVMAAPGGLTQSLSYAADPSITLGAFQGNVYNFSVRGRDDAGNVSPASVALSYSTVPSTSIMPYVVDHGASNTSVTLAWPRASDDQLVTAYDIYNGATKLATVTSSLNEWTTSVSMYNNARWSQIVVGPTSIVSVGYAAYPIYSRDNGLTWSVGFNYTAGYYTDVAYGNGMFVATMFSGFGSPAATILVSTDGITWESVQLPIAAYWTSIEYGNGRFVAISGNPVWESGYGYTSSNVVVSTDGLTWTAATLPSLQSWASIVYGNGIFLAFAGSISGTSNAYAISADGVNWTQRAFPTTTTFYGEAYGNGLFVVAVGVVSTIYTSPDGITWTSRTLPTLGGISRAASSVAYGNGMFMAGAASYASVWTSTDGITWTARQVPVGPNGNGTQIVSYVNGKFFSNMQNYMPTYIFDTSARPLYTAPITQGQSYTFSIRAKDAAGTVAASSLALPYSTTPNAPTSVTLAFSTATSAVLTWVRSIDDVGITQYDVYAGGGLVTSVTPTTVAAINSVTLSNAAYFIGLTYAMGMFVAFSGTSAYSSLALYSYDGINWTAASVASAPWSAVTYGNNKFVAVAGHPSYTSSVIAYSSDGVTWTSSSNLPTSYAWTGIAYGNGTFVAVAYQQTHIAISSDGINWYQVNNALPGTYKWTTVQFLNGMFITLGYSSSAAAYSYDGINWTLATLPTTASWKSVTYGNGRFVAVAGNAPNAAATDTSISTAYSTNGITWTAGGNLPSASSWNDVSFGNGRFFAVAMGSATAAYSIDGSSWTAVTGLNTFTTSTTFGNGQFAILSSSNMSWIYNPAPATTATVALVEGQTYSFTVKAKDGAGNVSPASLPLAVSTIPTVPGAPAVGTRTGTSIPLTWTGSTDNDAVSGYDIYDGTSLVASTVRTYVGVTYGTRTLNFAPVAAAYGNGKIVLLGYNYYAVSTDNGNTFTVASGAPTVYASAMTFGSSYFVAVSGDQPISYTASSVFYRSTDGVTWSTVSAVYSTYWSGIAANGTNMVAVAGGNYTSTTYSVYSTNDGASWTGVALPYNAQWMDVAAGPTGKFIAVSYTGGFALSSTSGASWTGTIPANAGQGWMAITYVTGNIFVAVGNNGSVIRTTDGGSTWSFAQPLSTSYNFNKIVYVGSLNALIAYSGDYTTAGYAYVSTDQGITWTAMTVTGWTITALAVGSSGRVIATAYNTNSVVIHDAVAPLTKTLTIARDNNYSFTIKARDAAGNASAASAVTPYSTFDTTPPGTPTFPWVSTVTTTSAIVNWVASTDDWAVTAYEIRQNGSTIFTPTGTTTSYTDTTLAAGTQYSYEIRAVDADGNRSGWSTPTYTTTPPVTRTNGGMLAWGGPNDTLLAVATTAGTPYLTAYQVAGTTLTPIAIDVALPTANTLGVSWSPDGQYLAIAFNASPWVYVYYYNGVTLTRVSATFSNITGTVYSVSWSPDSTKLLVSAYTNATVNVFTKVGSGTSVTFTRTSFISLTNATYCSWAPNGKMVATLSTSSPYGWVYPVDDAGNLGAGISIGFSYSGNDLAWSPDSRMIATVNTNTTSQFIFYLTNGAYGRVDVVTLATPTTMNGVSWSKDGTLLAYQHTSTAGSQGSAGWTGNHSVYQRTVNATTGTFTFTRQNSVLPLMGSSYTGGIRFGKNGLAMSGNAAPFLAVSTQVPALDTTAPAAPTAITVQSVIGHTVNMYWTNTDSSVTSFIIRRGTDTNNKSVIANIEGYQTYFIDVAPTAGLTYYYDIGAEDAAGNVSWSLTVAVTMPATSPVPSWFSKTDYWPYNANTNRFRMIYANGKYWSVSSGTGIISSSVDGLTWTHTYSSALGNNVWGGLAYGNGMFVLTGSNSGFTAYSTDGANWTVKASSISTAANFQRVVYGNGRFVTVSSTANVALTYYSTDGITWVAGGALPATSVNASGYAADMTYGDGWFVASSTLGTLAKSVDGTAWTQVTAVPSLGTAYSISYADATHMFVVTNNTTTVYHGQMQTGTGTWINSGTSTLAYAGYIGFADPVTGTFYTAGNGNYWTHTSTDGINWKLYPASSAGLSPSQMVAGNGQLLNLPASSGNVPVQILGDFLGTTLVPGASQAVVNKIDWIDDSTLLVNPWSINVLSIWGVSGNTITKKADPDIQPIPGTYVGTPSSMAANANGYIVMGYSSATPWWYGYYWDGSLLSKMATALPALTAAPTSMAWDATNTIVAVGWSGVLRLYKMTGTGVAATFTQLPSGGASVSGVPNLNAIDWWSTSDTTTQYLAVGTTAANYLYLYKVTTANGLMTVLTAPTGVPTGQILGLSWSPNGLYLAVTSTASPYLYVYYRNGDTFTKLASPSTIPTTYYNSVSWSPDGNTIALSGNAAAPYQMYYSLAGAGASAILTQTTAPSRMVPTTMNAIQMKYASATPVIATASPGVSPTGMNLLGADNIADLDPPTVPVVTVSNVGTVVTATWTTDDDAKRWEVYRNNALQATVTTPSYSQTIAADGVYNYTVRARDAAGNWSAKSDPAQIIMDVTPPNTPTLATGQSSGTLVLLDWDSNPDTVLYEVFRDGVSQGTTTDSSFSQYVLTDGTFNYTLRSQDAAGNWSAQSLALSVTVDTTAPIVPLLTITTNGLVNTLKWTLMPTATLYEVQRDGVSIGTFDQNTSTTTDTVPADGSYIYQVRDRDSEQFGNYSGWSPIKTAINDNTPPAVPVPTATSAGSTVAVQWPAVTDATQYQVYRSGVSQGTITGTTFTQTIPGDGDYSYTVRAKDAANNWSAQSATTTVTVDATPPTVPVLNTPTSFGNVITVTWNSNPDVALYEVFRDGNTQGTTTNTTFDNAVSVDGTVFYTVRARDAAGNWSAQSDAVSITVDTVPPPAPVASVSSVGAVNTVTWAATSTAVLYEVARNGTSLGTTATLTMADTVTQDGSYLYTVRARDAAGNWSAYGTGATAINDATPPTVPTIASVTAAAKVITVTWDTNADAALFEVFRNGTSQGTQTASTLTQTVATDGTYSYTVRAKDSVGNWSAQSTASSVVVDTTAPTVPTITATAVGKVVTVSWPANTDFATVTVFRAGTQVGTVSDGSTSYTDTVATDGTYAYTVKVADTAGNTSAASTAANVTVDTTPPTVPTINSGSAVVSSRALNISWNSNADVALYELFRDGVSVGTTTATNLGDTVSNDGTFVYTVRAKDATGNWSAQSAGRTITVDTTPPTVPTAAVTHSGSSATVTWDANADATLFEVFRGGVSQGTTASTTFTQTSLSDGTYVYNVRAKDAAGNWSAQSAGVATTIDTTPPTVSTPTAVRTALGTTDRSVLVSWTAAVDAVGFEVRQNSTTVGSGTTASTFTDVPIADGTFTYGVRVKDAEGNWSAWSNATPVLVDTVPPFAIGSFTAVNTPTTKKVVVAWGSWSDTVGYELSRGVTVIYTGIAQTFTDTVATDGTYTYSVRGKDASQNWGPSSTATVVVDTTPPTVPTVTTSRTAATVDVAFTSSVDAVLFEIFRGGVSQGTTAAGTFSQTNVADGTYNYTVRAKDAAGNWSAQSQASTIIVDNTPPTVGTVNVARTSMGTANRAVTMNWTMGADTVAFEVQRNGTTIGNGTTQTTFSDTPDDDGVYTYGIRAKDQYDNWSSWKLSSPITVDTTPPSTPVVSATVTATTRNVSISWNSNTDATGYEISRDGSVISTTTGTTAADTVPTDGTFVYSVRSKDTSNNWGNSGTATVTVDTVPPTVPTINTSVVTGTRNVTVSWTGDTDVAAFEVRRNGTTVTSSAGGTFYVDTTPADGTFIYTVRAKDATGNWSGYSNGSQAVVDTVPPAVPTNVRGDATRFNILVSWTGASDAVAYDVLRDGQRVAGSAFTSVADTVPTYGTYHYKVRAQDAAGNWSQYSDEGVVEILDTDPPAVPVNVKVNVIGIKKGNITWDADPDVSVWEVYRNGVLLISRTTNSFVDTVADYGTYTYSIRAKDIAGNWSAQSEVTANSTVKFDSGAPTLGRSPIEDITITRLDEHLRHFRRMNRDDQDQYGGFIHDHVWETDHPDEHPTWPDGNPFDTAQDDLNDE